MSGPPAAPVDPFAELKTRQAVAWGAAPFERIAETFADIHDRLISLVVPRSGERCLDLACGTGPLALRAARAGATVTGIDLAPALVDTARRLAAAQALPARFEVGDCERLARPDASADAVMSSFGVIFAPDHRAVAAELARVCRPGGRLGLACWRPGGGAHRMMALTASFMASPPPPGVGDPFDWGRESYVAARLGPVFELTFEEGDSPHLAPSAESVWELYATAAGPVKRLVDSLEPARKVELQRAFIRLLDVHRADGRIRYPREYLLVLGRRRSA